MKVEVVKMGEARYVPKDGDEYCFIRADGAINVTFWHADAHNLAGWAIGNVFRDYVEAERHSEEMIEKMEQIKYEMAN